MDINGHNKDSDIHPKKCSKNSSRDLEIKGVMKTNSSEALNIFIGLPPIDLDGKEMGARTADRFHLTSSY